MKTFIKISMLMLMMFSIGFSESLQAQSPEKMSYQAVIRDGSDNLITSSNVGMRIQILQGSISGTSIYEETHTATTNANGLVSIQVGAGNVVSGDFTNIDWGNDSYYIKNEIDPTGGTNYSITGTSQLLSVPYALYAKTSDSPIPGPQGPPGSDGNGIASTTDNGDGTFTFTYDDGSTFTTSDLTGSQGPAGPSGSQGPPGPQGPPGTDGNGIASTTDNGDGTFTFTYDDGSTFTTSDLTGPQGDGFDDGTAIGNTVFWDGNDWVENDFLYNDGSKIGIGNTTPEASFHVGGFSAEDGILVTGTIDQGQDLSISGAGTRMFFYPKKAAFRAGRVNGNQWDNSQIGDYSSAWGQNTEASGEFSTAWGNFTKASDTYSTAWGVGTVASGFRSTAWGSSTEASGSTSTAWGDDTQASATRSTAWGGSTEATGVNATAWGIQVSAKSYLETGLGRYNTDYTPNSTTSWNANDRLFGIGNGTSLFNRSDAMVVLKNGKTGIGLSNPQFDLAVSVSDVTNIGEGIALVSPSSNWNIDIDSFSDLAFNYNNNNVSYINSATGAYVQTSDRSLKENIQPITQNVLDKLQQINVLQYNYKRDKTKTQTTGVIAQELKQLFPDFVHHDGKNSKLGVNYAGLSLVAIQGIQEQQEQIDKLEVENKEQQEQIDQLESKIKILEQKMNSIIKSN